MLWQAIPQGINLFILVRTYLQDEILEWITEVYGITILLDISKFSSPEMAQFFTPIRTVKDSFLSLRPHRHRVSSSVWMFANQISKKWYLGVVLLYISLIVVVGWNIFSEYLKDYVYFLCCELNVQLSVCLFYYLFQRLYFECICICDSFSVFQCIDFCFYFYFLYSFLLHFSVYNVVLKMLNLFSLFVYWHKH